MYTISLILIRLKKIEKAKTTLMISDTNKKFTIVLEEIETLLSWTSYSLYNKYNVKTIMYIKI